MSDYTKGYMIMLLVVCMVSLDAVTIRFSGVDGTSVAFFRNGGVAISMFILALFTYGFRGIKGHVESMSGKSIAMCLLFGVSGTFFSMAIQETSVVNVLLMFVLSPLLAVVMSSIFLKERINSVVKFSSIFVLSGTFWAYKDSFDAGFDLGILYALIFVIANSGMSIVGRSLTKTPGSIVVMIGCGFWAILLSFTSPTLPTSVFAGANMLANVLIIAITYWALVYASKSVPAPEVNLLLITETFFGSLTAWWILNEVPSFENILGGVIAIIAVVLNLSYSVYLQRNKNKLKH